MCASLSVTMPVCLLSACPSTGRVVLQQKKSNKEKKLGRQRAAERLRDVHVWLAEDQAVQGQGVVWEAHSRRGQHISALQQPAEAAASTRSGVLSAALAAALAARTGTLQLISSSYCPAPHGKQAS